LPVVDPHTFSPVSMPAVSPCEQKVQHRGRATQSALRVGRALEDAVMRVTGALCGAERCSVWDSQARSAIGEAEAQTISEECAAGLVKEPREPCACNRDGGGWAGRDLLATQRVKTSASHQDHQGGTDTPSCRASLRRLGLAPTPHLRPGKSAPWMSEAASKSQREASARQRQHVSLLSNLPQRARVSQRDGASESTADRPRSASESSAAWYIYRRRVMWSL